MGRIEGQRSVRAAAGARHGAGRRTLALILLLLPLLAITAAPLQARNVPGSVLGSLGGTITATTDTLVSGVTGTLDRPGCEADLAAGRLCLGVTAGAQQITGDGLRGDALTGSAVIAFRLDSGADVFAGFLGERLRARTSFDAGRIDGRGRGLAFGARVPLGEGVALTGTGLLMRLDYDVSRNAGADRGSFRGERGVADLRIEWRNRLPSGRFGADIGLRYVRQNNDGYTESSGAAVGASRFEHFELIMAGRHVWAGEGLRPYLQGDLAVVLSRNSNLPPGILAGTTQSTRVRLGAGFEQVIDGRSSLDLGIGATLGGGGSAAGDIRLSYALRF